MRERTLFLVILLVTSTSFGKWDRVTERLITAFDMLTPQVGLAAAVDGAPLVMRLADGKEFGIINMTGEITSITIRDKDVAYMSVTGDGVYRSSGDWEFWKRIYAGPAAKFAGITATRTFVYNSKKLYYSTNEIAYEAGQGIDTVHPVTSVVGYGDRVIAASQTALYYSSDGGQFWTKKATLKAGGTLYLDTVGGIIIAGGNPVMISRDSGKSWSNYTTPVYGIVAGSVHGARDCSGAFYIVTDLLSLYELYRSADHGQSLQFVGDGPTYKLSTMSVVNRGSGVFWLNKDKELYAHRKGVDGNVTDSVASKVSVRADTGIVASACPGGKPVSFKLYLNYTDCSALRIDNVTIEGNGFGVTFTPRTVSAGELIVTASYKASKVGYDTGRIKVTFRSLLTNQTETKTASVVGRGISGPAVLELSTDNIAFGLLDTSDQDIRSISLLNKGCASFRIDSVVSSLPDVFSVSGSFPQFVLGGSRAYFNITFAPQAKQKYLESLEIYTSEGIRYVTLLGEGTFDPGTSAVDDPLPLHTTIELLSTVISGGEQLRIRSFEQLASDATLYSSGGIPVTSVIVHPQTITYIDCSGLASGRYFLVCAGRPKPMAFLIVR